MGKIKNILKKIPFVKEIRNLTYKLKDILKYQLFKLNIFLKFRNVSRKGFINDLKKAIDNKKGFAVGKMGTTEQQIMFYDVILKNNKYKSELEGFEKQLFGSFTKNAGVFPSEKEFILKYAKHFSESVLNLDNLGLFYHIREYDVLKHYNFKNTITYYASHEPDRSIPANDNLCYLPYFKGKKILIICPFGKFLASRANKEIFEAVWSKIGKKWFYPASIDSLEFPYGLSKSTQAKYGDAFNLLAEIKEEIKKKDFDIALIAAGGIAIPLASFIKSIGKIGISLGGHLQIVFGVIGGRWRNQEEWQTKYFNEHWVNVPENYIPKEKDDCENGCYW
ncbi:MAG: hypothetical protein A2086_11755 [Spirochaetes bacterium GWD1_27_9]|nr:MAG: hypothetical protein A2Y34_16665 [Spirochaetes bacterium GWC1_27_15]OHD28636.1 MAG: hypothetical protein A2086_11755 [Spirochaetes bacterium GWD1_27_9]